MCLCVCVCVCVCISTRAHTFFVVPLRYECVELVTMRVCGMEEIPFPCGRISNGLKDLTIPRRGLFLIKLGGGGVASCGCCSNDDSLEGQYYA